MKKYWEHEEVKALYMQPFMDLLYQAQQTHRQHFDANSIELCSLLSIKTAACPEDCGYCAQSGHHNTGLKKQSLLPLAEVLTAAQQAKAVGAKRFCMGAAWRSPPAREFAQTLAMIKSVKALGLETCMTLGMLNNEQADALAEAGLDYYNHNLDTSPDYYSKVVSTRTYQERLDTLEKVRSAGIKVCCGGIMGLGESQTDRIEFLRQLVNLPEPPKSVPINKLIAIPGTPLGNTPPIETIELIRVIAAARLLMPASTIRLSAGRKSLSFEAQALCFYAGANSIWCGDKLLTAANNEEQADKSLFTQLGLKPLMAE